MMDFIFCFILIVHGLIHVLGFVKAFALADVNQLTQNISRPAGVFWLIAALFFVATGIAFLLGKEWWWMIAIPSLVLSQLLIIMSWPDAKFGTVANLIGLVAVVLSLGSVRFENSFRNDVQDNLKRTSSLSEELLTEEDIRPLPATVQRYLRYVGAVNRPKVRSMRVVFEGQMRSKGKDYFAFTSVQYNFFDESTRLFYMKGRMFGVDVPGYHRYRNGAATMNIRLFGLIPMISQSGEILAKTETVTLFNDMCLMAPATLIDKRIRWQEIDTASTKAIFTNRENTITAILYFNEKGQLTNFLSTDRTEINDMKQYPFWTPVTEYNSLNGMKIMTMGETIWEYPDGKFTYGKFVLKSIEYNPNSYRGE